MPGQELNWRYIVRVVKGVQLRHRLS